MNPPGTTSFNNPDGSGLVDADLIALGFSGYWTSGKPYSTTFSLIVTDPNNFQNDRENRVNVTVPNTESTVADQADVVESSRCVAMDDAGDFAVAWVSNQSGNNDVYMRMYSGDGYSLTGRYAATLSAASPPAPATQPSRFLTSPTR